MFEQQYYITSDEINTYKDKLIRLSNITEVNIMNIWFTRNDLRDEDLGKLVYYYDAPVYQKMIWRFRNSEKSPAFLYNGCDPCNKEKLLKWFGLSNFELNNRFGNRLMEFFVWLKSSYSEYQCKNLLQSNDTLYVHTCINNWNINEITFFFGLLSSDQQKLIDEYNKVYKDFNI